MAQRILTLILIGIGLLFTGQAVAQNPFELGSRSSSRFLPVDQAFSFDFQQQGSQLTLQWQIHDGYYLYRQQIKLIGNNADVANVELPPGTPHHDEFFGEVSIFRQTLSLPVTLLSAESNATLNVTYQGCADNGFCYPPETRKVPLSAVSQTPAAIMAMPVDTPSIPLPFSPLWALLIGVGVAFTPCVLPMYPLISGLILGQRQRLSSRRTLLLSMLYIQGMALTYTLLGVLIAYAGLRFQAALQHPYVLTGISVLFIALALSMFGLYNLQLPSSLQTRLTLWSNRQQGGSTIGVFMMGALAGLICSPCTTAPLSALLLYIAQSGDLPAGAGTLYLYALGMGLPLLGITLFGNRLLPKRGAWMNHVKEGFGFVILALPIFLLGRVVGDIWEMRMWALLGVAFFSWGFVLSLAHRSGWMRIIQVIMLAGALLTVRPLQDWLFMPVQAAQDRPRPLAFSPVGNLNELNHSLSGAGRITMLDMYADWCVACKEFEKYTFSDAQVQQRLSQLQLLQADVTANSDAHQALLRHFQVLGLPTILFFDANGREIPGSRVTGLLNATDFVGHLQKLPR
ncbi:protein-disulfide reductase DsbD [Musicola keenii]|uniref:protein-disulfide reductase DsbD n=1 Tax=Musicola keenii TaxID=2884250 RepID=UPI001781AE5F|nr:protein-disulfide reductase DsbD [Musicola keenii]